MTHVTQHTSHSNLQAPGDYHTPKSKAQDFQNDKRQTKTKNAKRKRKSKSWKLAKTQNAKPKPTRGPWAGAPLLLLAFTNWQCAMWAKVKVRFSLSLSLVCLLFFDDCGLWPIV
jgi:hypothetical protein